jgi:hypothetical protein
MRGRLWISALTAVVLLAACPGNPNPQPTTSVSPAPTPAPSTTSPPLGGDDDSPYTRGTARLQASSPSAIELDLSLDLEATLVDGENVQLAWTDEEGRGVGIRTQVGFVDGPTTEQLQVRIVLGDSAQAISTDGECSLAFSTVTASSVEGDLSCDDLETTDGELIDATVVFDAS